MPGDPRTATRDASTPPAAAALRPTGSDGARIRPRQEPGTAPRPPRAAIARLAGALALFAVTFVLVSGRRVVHTDEAWFLWVAHRVAHGDVLYRDVYSVTTAIPVWIAAGAVRVFGTQMLVVRVLSTACFVGSVLLACAVARRCALGRAGRALLVVALFLYGSPAAHFVSLYSQLAVLMALIALWCVLVWEANGSHAGSLRERRLLIGAGLAAGMSFGCKPNIGMLVIVGTALLVAARPRDIQARRRAAITDVGAVTVSFAAVVLGLVVPVAASGGWSAFVGDVIQEKGNYVRLLGGDVPPGISELEHLWSNGTSAFGRFLSTQSLVTLAAAVVLAVAIRRSRSSHGYRLAVLAVFTAIGALSAYPQAGPQHLTEVMPLILTAAAAAVPLARRPNAGSTHSRVALPAAAWCFLGAVLLVARAATVLPEAVTGAKPRHFAASSVSDTWSRQRRDLARLRRLTGGDVFIVRSDAAYFYLAGGLDDPTPYDFAARSDFGAADETGVVDSIAHHRIHWVCIRATYPPHHAVDVRPRKVEAAVRRHLRFTARLRTCDLYETPR